MKVYVVIGKNQEACEESKEWNDAVFISRESAEKYIQEKNASFANDNARLNELLYDIEELTMTEKDERNRLLSKWRYFCGTCPCYRIEEYETQI